MRFELIDRVIERTPTRVVALKQVTMGEEYLADHFPSFPVLPGVLMLEALVQAARLMAPPERTPMVLGRVRALKYGALVRPGDRLRIEVDRVSDDSERHDFKGKALLIPSAVDPAAGDQNGTRTAASGRFELRPLRPGLSVAG